MKQMQNRQKSGFRSQWRRVSKKWNVEFIEALFLMANM